MKIILENYISKISKTCEGKICVFWSQRKKGSKELLLLGQSLFEVLFAVGISALILISVISLSTQSVRTGDFSKNNASATKYAQEAIEWVRQQRDILGWDAIRSRVGPERAFGVLDLSGSENPIPGTIFNRYLTMSYYGSGTDTVLVEVKVTWADGAGTHEVKNSTKLTNWRR
jgi:Tfp pilus assembly protein PilV